MLGLDSSCSNVKCCICAKQCLCSAFDNNEFVLASKDMIEDRLERYSYRVSEVALMRDILNSMDMKERLGEIEEKVHMEGEKTYEQGLEDAWEIARKIMLNEDNGGLSMGTIHDIFVLDCSSPIGVIRKYGIHEVIDKIEAWKKEQTKPKLGDVVKIRDVDNFMAYRPYEGIYLHEDENGYAVLLRFGTRTHIQHLNVVTTKLEKTGKHFDIDNMLDEIGW